MCVVDAWLCFKNTVKTGTTQEDLYMTLAEELIDNDMDSIRLRRRRGGGEDGETSRVVGNDGRPKDSDGIHVTPIAKNMSGRNKNHTIQLRCKICSKRQQINAANVIHRLQSALREPVGIALDNTTSKRTFSILH